MAAVKPVTTYKGKTVPLFNSNIDTNQIIPKAHLRRIPKSSFDPFVLDERRYLPDGSDSPNFNPNKPQYEGASILIIGDNFGCGSSHEHAARALKDYGFHIVITGSFSDIFYVSCTKNAILPIVLEKSTREHLAQYAETEVDLPNQTVSSPDKRFHFEIDETWKNKLVNGLDDVTVTLQYESLIEKYEKSL